MTLPGEGILRDAGRRVDTMRFQTEDLLKTTRRLSTTTMNFAIPTTVETVGHALEVHGTESWRYRLLGFLHSRPVQWTMVTLLLLDVLLLFIEVALMGFFPSCAIIERDAVSCCPDPTFEFSNEADHAHRILGASSQDDASHYMCEAGFAPDLNSTAGCDPHKYDTVHTTEEVLFGMTITILSIMFLELNLSMIALTPFVYFRQFFFCLDYFIVLASLVLELVFHFLKSQLLQSLSGLLITIRLWRFVRIGHGLMEVTTELAHHRYERLLNYAEDLEDLLKQNAIEIPATFRTESVMGLTKKEPRIIAKVRRTHHQHKHHHDHSPEHAKDDEGTRSNNSSSDVVPPGSPDHDADDENGVSCTMVSLHAGNAPP